MVESCEKITQKALITISVMLTTLFSCSTVKVLTLKNQKYYSEESIFMDDSIKTLYQNVFYNKPEVMDEEHSYNLTFKFIDTSKAKQKRTLTLLEDTSIIKFEYDFFSIWDWTDESYSVKGNLKIKDWQTDSIGIETKILVRDYKRKQKLKYNGIRTFKKNNPTTNQNSVLVDTIQYAILQVDYINNWKFKNARSTILSKEEIEEIDLLIKKCIGNYNPEQQQLFDSLSRKHPEADLKIQNFIIDLKRYRRQYFPVINEKGEKEIWVNCFCQTYYKDWKNQVISVRDGGNCYFNLKINLTLKTYYGLMVNDSV